MDWAQILDFSHHMIWVTSVAEVRNILQCHDTTLVFHWSLFPVRAKAHGTTDS